LVITKRNAFRCAHVLVAPNILIGMVVSPPRPPSFVYRDGARGYFVDCTCGKWRIKRSKCICGARSGSVQPSSTAEGAWIVDLRETYCITPRPVTMDRGQTGEGTGAMLFRRARTGARWLFGPVVCEVVEADPGFDWGRHGTLVALAALCDDKAARVAFPEGGGG
jgi:hypothetical protein